MTSRVVVVDDKTQTEIPKGVTYFSLTIRYFETDMQYQTGTPKYMYLDAQNWGDVVDYLSNGIPASTVELNIIKRTN